MRRMKQITAALLALLMLMPTLAACGEDTVTDIPDDTTAAVQDTTAETQPAETLRADAKDNLPADLNLGGKTVGIFANAGVRRKVDVDGAGEEIGDVVYDAVYNRTRSVADRLNAVIEVTEMSATYKDYGAAVEANILAGDDFWQIISISSNACIGFNRNHLFQDLQDNKYLDFDQPWWWKDAMMELTLDNKSVKYLIGDIGLSSYYYSGALFFNKTLLQDNNESEEALYQTVLDRKWTVDRLNEMAARMYRDLDGDGSVSDKDVLGLYLDTYEYVKFMGYGADVKRYYRDDNGYPVMEYDLDRAEVAVTKLMKLLNETKGVEYMRISKREYTRFAEGRSVFYGGLLGDAMESALRSMEDAYGILPYPMLDENQTEYTNFIHPSSAFMTIPITCKTPDETGAVLEAMCSESYRSVIETFLETAMKAKYAHDSQSAQCIDIIRSVSVKSFLADYTSVGGGFLIEEQLRSGVNNLASSYASNKDKVNGKIQTLIEQYKNLAS